MAAAAVWDKISVFHLRQCCCLHTQSQTLWDFKTRIALVLKTIFLCRRHVCVSQCLEIRGRCCRVAACHSLFLRSDVTNDTQPTLPFITAWFEGRCSVSLCESVCRAVPVAGADLPQCELYEKRSCITLSDWRLPYLAQSAAWVPGGQYITRMAGNPLTQSVIDWDQSDVTACCEFTLNQFCVRNI